LEPITFTDLKLNKQLVSAVEDLNYTTPSPIQIKAIPLIMAGHDELRKQAQEKLLLIYCPC
jgi:ATP-dependent RNA helicase RhlE